MWMIETAIAWASHVVEAAGVLVIVLGAVLATGAFLLRWRRSDSLDAAYQDYRADLGRAILLGLELLVGADIIATVTLGATLEGLAVLAAVVLVRTFLSFILEVEISGRWPWQGRSGDDR